MCSDGILIRSAFVGLGMGGCINTTRLLWDCQQVGMHLVVVRISSGGRRAPTGAQKVVHWIVLLLFMVPMQQSLDLPEQSMALKARMSGLEVSLRRTAMMKTHQ